MGYSLAGKRVWVAGHRGMVGAALHRRLGHEDCTILTADRATLDLRCQQSVVAWMAATRPQAIFLAAARVGGIAANTRSPADFLYDNLMITANVVHAAHANGVEKLLVLGSSAIYPRLAPQPMREDALLTGPLEPTHEAYAIAKIAGIKLVQAFARQHGCNYIAAVPTNLYGPGDRFDLESGHVVPSLICKVHDAITTGASAVTMWGTGTARREFLHADDCADACMHLMHHHSGEQPINLGSGVDLPVADLLAMIAEIVGFRGKIVPDASKPEGPPRKLMDSSRLAALGWRPRIGLREGLTQTYRWYCDHVAARLRVAERMGS